MFTNEKRCFRGCFGRNTSSKWSVSLLVLLVRIVKSFFLAFVEQFFSFMRKNILKMRRMRKLVNYVDLHHRILSDALHKDSQTNCTLSLATQIWEKKNSFLKEIKRNLNSKCLEVLVVKHINSFTLKQKIQSKLTNNLAFNWEEHLDHQLWHVNDLFLVFVDKPFYI